MRSSRQQESPCWSAARARNRYSPRSSGRSRGRMPSLRRRWSIHANDRGMVRTSRRHQQRQGLFQWHGMISVMGSARREGVATPFACSAASAAMCLHHREKNRIPATTTDFKPRWNRKNTHNRTRTARGRTTSEGYPINGSTRQLLCALARGSRTMWVRPLSATQLSIRGDSHLTATEYRHNRKCALRGNDACNET